MKQIRKLLLAVVAAAICFMVYAYNNTLTSFKVFKSHNSRRMVGWPTENYPRNKSLHDEKGNCSCMQQSSLSSTNDEEMIRQRNALEKTFNEKLTGYMAMVANERLAGVDHACRRLQLPRKTDLKKLLALPAYKRPRFYFSDKYKILLCEVPKCGSTSWRKALLMMEGDVNVTSPSEIPGDVASIQGFKRSLWNKFPGRDNKTLEEIKYRMENYFRIMTVREPMQRLVSAYNDKMKLTGTGGSNYAAVSKKIHEAYGDQRAVRGEDAEEASWSEFVRYLADPEKTILMDPHWNGFTDLCDPCAFNYNYIAKLETVSKDAAYVSQIIDYDLSEFFPDTVTNRRQDKWNSKYTSYFENLTQSILDELYHVYSVQYELFGYSKPPFID